MKNILVLVLSLVIVFAVSCNSETEHKHSYVEKTVAPTCTEDGKTYKECSTCGYIIVIKELPATGHNDKVVKLLKTEPAGENDGLLAYACPDCKEVMDIEVFAKDYSAEDCETEVVNLEKMDESLLNFMSEFIKLKEYPYDVIKVESSHLVIENGVFKKDTTFQDNIETKTYSVKEGTISLIRDTEYTEGSPLIIIITADGSITQEIIVDEKKYEVVMDFKNATFNDKNKPKLVNEDSFNYKIVPEDSGISKELIIDEAWNLLDDLINTGEYLSVLSNYDIKSQTIFEYKD